MHLSLGKIFAFSGHALLSAALLSFSSCTPNNPTGNPLYVSFLSTASTLPGADGLRLMTVSFRVTNTRTFRSFAPSSPATATIAFGTNSAALAIPALASGATAYVSRTVQTASAKVTISVSVTPNNRRPVAGTLPSQAEVNAAPISVAAPSVTPDLLPIPPANFTPIPSGAPPTLPVIYTIAVAGDTGRWQSVGPFQISDGAFQTGGRVTNLAIDPRNPDIVYAGGRGCGLWRTLGIRTVWLPMTDSLPSQQVEALALDPNNPDHLVIVTDAGVYESVDDGNVWTQLNPTDLSAIGYDGGHLLIATGPNPAMYLTSGNGLLTSTDGGRNWSPVIGTGVQSTSIQFNSADHTQIFAAVGKGVYEGVNGGLAAPSWHQLQGCPDAPLPQFDITSSLWVAESKGAMWISSRNSSQAAFYQSTAETCMVAGFPEHGWKSVTLSSDCSDFVNNWSYLFMDPNDPSIVYKAGIGLCRITGSGSASSILPVIHNDQHAIAVAPSDASIVYFGSDGGIFRSADQGRTLSFYGQGMANAEFLATDVDGTGFNIVGVSQDNGMESWDGSSSSIWTKLGGGDGVLVSTDKANPAGIYWMSQSTRQLFHNQNGLTVIGDSSLADCKAYVDFPAKLLEGMISTGTTPAVYTTCTGLWTGPPWTQVQTAQGNFTRVGFNRKPATIAAATDAGEVFYGSVGQSPLSMVLKVPGLTPASISFASATTFYVAMNSTYNAQGSIYRIQCATTCTSETAWSNTANGEAMAVTYDPMVRNSLLAAVRNKGIFRGLRDTSGNWAWTPYNDGLPAAITITDLKPRADGSIAAVSYGRAAYTINTLPISAPPVYKLSDQAPKAADSR